MEGEEPRNVTDVLVTLAQSEDERKRFGEDPTGYLREAGLDDQQIAVLERQELDEIRELVQSELPPSAAVRWSFIFICPF